MASEGYEHFGSICPQENASPRIGGQYDCTGGDQISIIGYPNLNTRPEFARVINQGQNITMDDLLAYDIQHRKNIQTNQGLNSEITLEGQTETTVNVVDPIINQTIRTLPAREVVYGISISFGDAVPVTHSLIVLNNNKNIGYSIRSSTEENIELDDGMPTFVRQAFDSFELLSNSSQIQQSVTGPQQQSQQNNATAATTTAPLSSNSGTGSNSNTTARQTQQQEQEEQQPSSLPSPSTPVL